MKIIRFVPELEDKKAMLIEPQPGKKLIPDWYKNGETFWSDENGQHPGLKTCKPFIDSMIYGYFLIIPFDIHISENKNGELQINWDGPDEWNTFINERKGSIGSTIPVPAGHRKNHLTFYSKWGWKTPRGWSSIVTHPLNRSDLPFRTMTGLIDSDKFFSNGNIAWHIREGWTGIIPAGTPFAQIIPIKRSSWRSFADYGLTKLGWLKSINARSQGYSYKSKDWVKKDVD